MPGPPPKHPDDRSRRNARPTLEVLPVLAAPAPPPGLCEEVLAEWDAFWVSPLAATVAETDLAALERLFRFRDQQRQLAAFAAEAPLLEGSQGQLVANPAARQALALEPHILHLEDRFSLSPKARLAHGIRLGQAADVAKRHPDVFGADPTQEPAPRADPRLAQLGAAAPDSRSGSGALDGGAPRPR